MRGYHDASYGDSFADVYDDWYADITDVDATTDTLDMLATRADPTGAGGTRILELGVGTGRLALPLAARGHTVHGIDSSERMLAAMAAKPGGASVVAHLGDMVDDIATAAEQGGPFDVIFVAYNTLFNLLAVERQQACFVSAARHLAPGGAFVVEAFDPTTPHDRTADVGVRSITADRVVLSVSTSDPATQRAEGQYVEFTEAGGVRLRPWSIRWATTAQLDAMAAAAGLEVVDRWEDFNRRPFAVDSPTHVSVYSPSARHRLTP